jgi:hypothetical protein
MRIVKETKRGMRDTAGLRNSLRGGGPQSRASRFPRRPFETVSEGATYPEALTKRCGITEDLSLSFLVRVVTKSGSAIAGAKSKGVVFKSLCCLGV